jgi:hypothetical protein
MTVLGKILVFLILVLALAQGAFHVMLFLTQPNWVKKYDEVKAQYVVAVAEAETYKVERDEARSAIAEKVKDSQAELETTKNQLKVEKEAKALLETQLAAEKDKVMKGDSNVARSSTDIQRRSEETKRLEDTRKADQEKIRALLDDNNKLRDRAVVAEIENRSVKERNSNLVNQLEDMSKELIKFKNGTGGAGSGTLTAKNPPPENVEGLVTKVDSSGLMTLSVGSDAGILKGHTLEAFRMNPPKYLGTVRVVQTSPHEAVAQWVSRPLASIQQGDRVASKILGN